VFLVSVLYRTIVFLQTIENLDHNQTSTMNSNKLNAPMADDGVLKKSTDIWTRPSRLPIVAPEMPLKRPVLMGWDVPRPKNTDGTSHCYWTKIPYGSKSGALGRNWDCVMRATGGSNQLCPCGNCFSKYECYFTHLQSIGRMLLARKKYLTILRPKSEQ
jgi:hypothetical protein